jgi:hypothetical protein
MRKRWSCSLVVIIALTVAGCASPFYVEAAPYAGDPGCAPIMLAAPEQLGGLDYRVTTSQATAAWGEEFVLVARCGVEPPGPTTDVCIAVTTASADIEWVIQETETDWLATTFGLTPAVEFTIPKIRVDEALPDVLAELSPAAALAAANGLECS